MADVFASFRVSSGLEIINRICFVESDDPRASWVQVVEASSYLTRWCADIFCVFGTYSLDKTAIWCTFTDWKIHFIKEKTPAEGEIRKHWTFLIRFLLMNKLYLKRFPWNSGLEISKLEQKWKSSHWQTTCLCLHPQIKSLRGFVSEKKTYFTNWIEVVLPSWMHASSFC